MAVTGASRAGCAEPQDSSHYPLAQEASGTGVGSWQRPHAPAGTSGLTGKFLALVNAMEKCF